MTRIKIKKRQAKMTREEKCLYLIDKGYTYNPETGEIKNPKGKVLKCKKDNYLIIHITKFNLYQHQFAWYYIYGEIVEQLDHINGIGDDNRISNLRNVTHQQNQWNRVNAKGYYFYKRYNKWHTGIRINNKTKHIGYFNTEEEARNAYLEAKKKYHIIS